MWMAISHFGIIDFHVLVLYLDLAVGMPADLAARLYELVVEVDLDDVKPADDDAVLLLSFDGRQGTAELRGSCRYLVDLGVGEGFRGGFILRLADGVEVIVKTFEADGDPLHKSAGT